MERAEKAENELADKEKQYEEAIERVETFRKEVEIEKEQVYICISTYIGLECTQPEDIAIIFVDLETVPQLATKQVRNYFFLHIAVIYQQ